MIPLVLAARRDPRFRAVVCLTAQHRQMVDAVLKLFKLKPDYDLNIMLPGQQLPELTARILGRVKSVIRDVKPHALVIQGDTTTAFTVALAAFYEKIPVVHVEAGLRSGNKQHPFPEETNRTLISHLADYHFAPTASARANLLREGVAAGSIFVTGNTIVDTIKLIRPKLSPRMLPLKFQDGRKVLLVTAHRRESFGAPLRAICGALRELAERHPALEIVYPVHLNPHVRRTVMKELGARRHPNIHLIEPLPYEKFLALLNRCDAALTDSGGIQEEAPSFGKPVLVMRRVSERVEGLHNGHARLVGTSQKVIVRETSRVLAQKPRNHRLKRNPYGDGNSSRRILNVLARSLSNRRA